MKKIAIPVTTDNQIDDHFGHCAYYGIYSISDKNRLTEVETLEAEKGCGCKSNIANVLSERGVSILLAGGIGNGAINVLNNHGIQVIRGCNGLASDIVEKYIKGEIVDGGISCLQHEQHHGSGHTHTCNH